MITTKAKLLNMNGHEMEVTMSMTIGEWKGLLACIDESKYPGSIIVNRIRDITQKLNKEVYENYRLTEKQMSE